jgi:hypothetical protein
LQVTLDSATTLLATTQIWGTGLTGKETEPHSPHFYVTLFFLHTTLILLSDRCIHENAGFWQ